MAGEFIKPNNITPAVLGQIANPDDYNQNIAGQSKGSIVGIDIDGSFADVDLGDESLITNGALIKNIKLRQGYYLKFYNASGVFQNDVNLGQATESLIGQAEIATQSEADTGTDDLRFITALKLKTRQGVRYVGRLTASSTTTLGQSLSTGKKYIFRFNNILPSVNATFLTAQYSTDGGSTLISSSYKNINEHHTNIDALGGATNKTSGLTLSGVDSDGNTGCGNTANKGGINGWFILDDPSNSTTYKQANWRTTFYNSTSFNYFTTESGGGVYEGATTAINYIGFTFKAVNSNTTSGNIVSGTIDVWEINA